MILLLVFIGGLIIGISFGYLLLRDIVLGPNSKIIYNKIFTKDNKCYRLIPKKTDCDLLDNHI